MTHMTWLRGESEPPLFRQYMQHRQEVAGIRTPTTTADYRARRLHLMFGVILVWIQVVTPQQTRSQGVGDTCRFTHYGMKNSRTKTEHNTTVSCFVTGKITGEMRSFERQGTASCSWVGKNVPKCILQDLSNKQDRQHSPIFDCTWKRQMAVLLVRKYVQSLLRLRNACVPSSEHYGYIGSNGF